MELFGQKNTIGNKIKKLQNFPLMKYSLIQGVGAELEPVVNVGDKVKCATIIAKCKENFLGANLHSSTSGEVVKIVREEIDKNCNANVVYIKSDDKNECEKPLEALNEIDLQSLCDRLNDCGVIGCGDGGFPFAVKLEKFKNGGLKHCFIDCACSDAFYTADISVLMERSNKVIRAIQIIKEATNCDSFIVVARRGMKRRFLSEFIMQIADKSHIYYCEIANKLCVGGDCNISNKILGLNLTNDEVLTDYGFICTDVQTLCALTDAVDYGLPMTSKVITCGGGAIAEPCNVDVKIGSLYEDIVDAVGGEKFALYKYESLEQKAKDSYLSYLDLRDEFKEDETDEEVKKDMVEMRKQSNHDILEFLKAEKMYKNVIRQSIICGGGICGEEKTSLEFGVTKSSQAILLLNKGESKKIAKMRKKNK